MSLMSEWRDMAYSTKMDKGKLKKLWDDYFLKEKEVYAQLLKNPDEEVKGTVKELAEKYSLTVSSSLSFSFPPAFFPLRTIFFFLNIL